MTSSSRISCGRKMKPFYLICNKFRNCCLSFVLLVVFFHLGPVASQKPKCGNKNVTQVINNKNHVCWPCPSCPVGFGSTVECGATVSMETAIKCALCKPGTFKDHVGEETCQYCGVCLENEEIKKNCTAFGDIQCGKCKRFYYRAHTGDCKSCADIAKSMTASEANRAKCLANAALVTQPTATISLPTTSVSPNKMTAFVHGYVNTETRTPSIPNTSTVSTHFNPVLKKTSKSPSTPNTPKVSAQLDFKMSSPVVPAIISFIVLFVVCITIGITIIMKVKPRRLLNSRVERQIELQNLGAQNDSLRRSPSDDEINLTGTDYIDETSTGTEATPDEQLLDFNYFDGTSTRTPAPTDEEMKCQCSINIRSEQENPSGEASLQLTTQSLYTNSEDLGTNEMKERGKKEKNGGKFNHNDQKKTQCYVKGLVRKLVINITVNPACLAQGSILDAGSDAVKEIKISFDEEDLACTLGNLKLKENEDKLVEMLNCASNKAIRLAEVFGMDTCFIIRLKRNWKDKKDIGCDVLDFLASKCPKLTVRNICVLLCEKDSSRMVHLATELRDSLLKRNRNFEDVADLRNGFYRS